MDTLKKWKQKYPNTTPGMHGGEPLLVKDEHLERIFKFIHENWDGQTHIQTNATMISDSHIEMFKKYNVGVGISCDGPPELNEEREARLGGEDVTDKMSEKTNDMIFRLSEERGVGVGIITVLHETNAGTDEKLETLLEWMDELNKLGTTGHYNPAIPYEDIQTGISLHPERLKEVYLRTWEWMKEEQYRSWNPMRQYIDNLLGIKLGNCVNNKCDVFNAGAAKIIKGDGESTGCGKTWSTVGDGVPFLQGPSTDEEYNDTEERYEMLKQVPGPYTEGEEDMGGCKGCEYWNVCQGGCPSAGWDDEYRNRTMWCKAKYALYEQIENDIRTILPNIRMITDLPWNAEVARHASRWDLDIKPFVAMDPGEPGSSSTFGRTEHPHGTVKEEVPDEAIPERSFDEMVEDYKRKHGEENVVVDREEDYIHADSDQGGWSQEE